MAVTYLNGGEEIVPGTMQALWASLDAKMNTLLNGRSPMLILPQSIYPKLYGMPFPFTSGASAYASENVLEGVTTTSIPDPVVGGTASVPAVVSYNHAAYTALAQGMTPLSFDSDLNTVEVADVPQGSYPSGHVKRNAVGVFERSLQAHTLWALKPGDPDIKEWFIKERVDGSGNGGSALATRKWNYAVAEIVIEGPDEVDLPDTYDAFGAYRLHNLQPKACTVTVGSGDHVVSIVLTPFECRTLKRNKTTRRFALCSMRYFWDYEDEDFRMFWFHGSLPTFAYGGQQSRTDTALTKAISMQANNLTNAALIYDWDSHLTSRDLKAYMVRDPHELCDIYTRIASYRTLYGDPSNPETLIGDLIHHKGTVRIVRRHKTLKEPSNPLVPLTTHDSVEFRGYATIVEDFAAKLLTVSEDVDGNLQIVNADPDNHVDLIGIGTNLLKHTEDTGGGGWAHWQLPTAISLEPGYENAQTPYKIENQIMESAGLGGSGQDVDGTNFPEASATHGYRITRKSLQTPQPYPFKSYEQREDLSLGEANLPAHQVGMVESYIANPPKAVAGIHKLKVKDFLSLAYNGDGTLASQDDALSTYVDKQLRLTPEGLVLTFTERLSVRLEGLPDSTIRNFAGRGYVYDESISQFTLKHAVRLRRHGFGWGQHGKSWAAFFPPYDGRALTPAYVGELGQALGQDFDLPYEDPIETPVKAISMMPYQRLGSPANGYLLTIGQAPNAFANTYCNMDGLVAFARNGTRVGWYEEKRRELTSRDGATASINGTADRAILAMPMAAEHYNGFAQAVNQLKTGKALSQNVYREWFGAMLMTFDSDEFTGIPITGGIGNPNGPGFPIASAIRGSGRGQLAEWGSNLARTVPMPMNLWCSLTSPPGGAGGQADYWQAFLASKGLPYKTGADMPMTAAQRTFRAKQAVLRITGQLSISGLTAVGCATFRGGTTSTWQVVTGAWDIFGTVTGSQTAAWLPDTDLGAVGDVAGEVTNGANLNNYTGVRWYSIEQAQALFDGLGIPFSFAQPCVPLRIAEMEWKPEVEVLENSAQLHTGRLIEAATFRLGNSTAPQTQAQADDRLNIILQALQNATYTETLDITNARPRKRQVFAVCAESEKEQALWKSILFLANGTSFGDLPYSYRVPNREEGDAVLYYPTAPVPGLTSAWNGWQNHVGFKIHVAPNGAATTLRFYDALNGVRAGSVPPWAPQRDAINAADAGWVVQTIGGAGPPSGGIGTSNQWRGRIGAEGSGVPVERNPDGTGGNYLLRFFSHATGRLRVRIATPATEAGRAAQDLWFRVANREAQWGAVLYYGPEDATAIGLSVINTAVGFVEARRFITAQGNQWGSGSPRSIREPGAFRDYPDGFFVLERGQLQVLSPQHDGFTDVAAGVDAVLPFRTTAVPDTGETLSRTIAPNALSILQPYVGESFRTFLDLSEPLVALP